MAMWPVLISGIGVRVVEAMDIDGAYAAVMAAHGCKSEDVLAVFRHSLVRANYGSGCYHSPTKKHRHGPGGNKCIWCGSTSNGSGCYHSPTWKHEK